MQYGARTGALATVAVALGLAAPAALACSQDEYLTPEEQASGLYDDRPSEWGGSAEPAGSGEPAPEPASAPAASAPQDPAAAEPQSGAGGRPGGAGVDAGPDSSGGSGPVAPRERSAGERGTDRPARRGGVAPPRPGPRGKAPAPVPAAIAPAPAAAASAVVTRSQGATAARPVHREPAASRDRRARAADRSAPRAASPAVSPATPRAGAAPRAIASPGARHELPGLALAGLAAVAAAALLWRRRRAKPSIVDDPLLPAPFDAAVEAELQEIIAEERVRAAAAERERAPLAG